MKKIGIISGLGAAAGARMYSDLIKEYQSNGAKEDSDFPEIIVHSLSSKGMDETGIVNEELIKSDLTNSIEMLNREGVEWIIIACNTVHIYHSYLQSKSKATILNMVEIACNSVKRFNKIGVISSSTTRKTKLYIDALSKFGIYVINTTNEQQKLVDEVIDKAISGKLTAIEHSIIHEIQLNMKVRGAKKIILGCTELPLTGVMTTTDSCIDPSIEMIKKVIKL